MKKTLYAAIVAIGIFDISEGMLKNSLHITYYSTGGSFVQKRLSDVDEGVFRDMSPESFEQISRFFQLFQKIQYHIQQAPIIKKSTDLLDQCRKLRDAITLDESLFLDGTEKNIAFLKAGYSKLTTYSDETAIKKLDENLCAMYAKSKNPNVCRKLAENYKELAISSENKDDFIKAAFWFRALYASGEHSSYLDEYNDMRLKAGL
jgi:hypothetical protein